MPNVETSKTVDSLDKIIGNLLKFEQNVLKDITDLGKKVAQSKSKGSLRRAISIDSEGISEKNLVAAKPYAAFIENGRGIVKPKTKKVLRFVINGKVVFAKSVGPVKPRPFMKPAGRTMREQAAKIAKDNWKRIL